MTLGTGGGGGFPVAVGGNGNVKVRFVKGGFCKLAEYQGGVAAGKIESVSEKVALDLIGSGWAVALDPVVRPTMSPSGGAPGVYRPGDQGDDERRMPGQ